MTDEWIWIRVKRRTLSAARAALQVLGVQLHNEASVEPERTRKAHLRAEADHYIKEESELQKSEMRAITRKDNE